MAGFSTVVGFMFSFFIIIGVIFFAFFTLIDDVKLKVDLIEESEKLSKNLQVDFSLDSPYYDSGRLSFILNNSGNDYLKFINENSYCFNVFLNGIYLDKSNYYINLVKPLSSNYQIIEKDSVGIISIETLDIFSLDNKIKIVSCEGVDYEYEINSSEIDWYNSNWKSRNIILVQNPSTQDLNQYQIEVDLSTSNFDFENARKKEIRLIQPAKENFVLNLPFDVYSQSLQDYSNFDNTVILGSTTSIETNDPNLTQGVALNSLDFDGNDSLLISSDPSLELSNEISLAMWVKWDKLGETYQYLYVNGNVNNSLGIINDGGINDDLVEFNLNIANIQTSIISNTTLDSSWNFIVGTYDGEEMILYHNGQIVANQTIYGQITTYANDNFIGSDGISNLSYVGDLDELSIFGMALNENEVLDLYNGNLRFIELDYFISDWNNYQEKAKIFIKTPFIKALSNTTLHLYYESSSQLITNSNIEKTFSYTSPKTFGYVVSDRISSSTGISIMSLYDNNTIFIGDDSFSLDRQTSSNLGTGSLNIDDIVSAKNLVQVEGNGDADDIIVPISWASTQFVYRGFRDSTDRFCLLSPWGIADYEIYDNGALENFGTVDSSGTCFDLDITTANNMWLNSTLPILVSIGNQGQDAFSFYPAVNETLYGSPSQTLYLAAGPNGADTTRVDSLGSSTSTNLGSFGTTNQGGTGPDGDSPAFKIDTNNLIGALQQADGDGTETTTFVPKYEFGNLFGASFDTDYIAVVSDSSSANCSIYDSLNTLVENVPIGTGSNDIYKYDFGVGNDNLYVSGNWRLECDEIVWPYYENREDSGDETNLLGHLQMRQYNYPEPIVSIS